MGVHPFLRWLTPCLSGALKTRPVWKRKFLWGQLRESLQENDGQKSWGEKMRLLLLQARLREQPAPAREMEFQPQNWSLLCGQ